jgi:hypothetical protein
MKALLSRRPVLWFLFLFNFAVAVVAGTTVHGSRGITTSIGMGAVAIGAGIALIRGRAPQT